jgi:5-methylcytosine-specific restriction endonuclease McrA
LAYAAQHKLEIAERMKQWASEHREYIKAYHAAYRHSDKPGAVRMRSKVSEYSARWRTKDVERARAQGRLHQQKRRAKANNNIDLSLIAYYDDDLCAICGLQLAGPIEIDHKVPLSRGGEHVEENMRRLHEHCNRAKSHRLDDELTHKIVARCVEKTVGILGQGIL